MDVLDENIAVWINNVHVCKVPDCLDAATDQAVCRFDSFLHRNTQNRYVNGIFMQIGFQRIHIQYHNAIDFGSDDFGINVKRCIQLKTPIIKLKLLYQSPTNVAGPDKNRTVTLIHADNPCNFTAQTFCIITISLLAKASKMTEILSNLRGSRAEQSAKVHRRDMLNPGVAEFHQLAVVFGKPADYIP